LESGTLKLAAALLAKRLHFKNYKSVNRAYYLIIPKFISENTINEKNLTTGAVT
jgi:hypothetical protein